MGSNLKLNDQIEEYINSHSIKLHPVQYEIIKYNETLGEIKKMQISISQCHFLHFIIKIIYIIFLICIYKYKIKLFFFII